MRHGTDQIQRFEAALNPDNTELHGLHLEDWMKFAYDFAKHVNYFSPQQSDNPVDDWQQFFAEGETLKKLLKSVEEPDGSVTPHMTLFLCFLQLLELPSSRLNGITKRHLDFYYKDILRIEKIPAVMDRAYILFELAKNASGYKVDALVGLDAGKDSTGKKRTYRLEKEIFPSAAKVGMIKNCYNDFDRTDKNGAVQEHYYMKAASVANSVDGMGEDLTAGNPAWYPFGYQHEETGTVALPDARIGFALASSVLLLAEGTRTITIEANLTGQITHAITSAALAGIFDVYLTGEKGWLGPFKPELDSQLGSQKLKLITRLSTDILPVTAYNAAVHGENYTTELPVIRFLLKTQNKTGYGLYKILAGTLNTVRNIQITVDVAEVRNLQLESDTALLNWKKPFYPFTTQPVRSSSFSVYSEEAFSKKWSSMQIRIKWKNTPLSFRTHYTAYDKSFLSTVSKDKYVNVLSGFSYEKADAEFALIRTSHLNKSEYEALETNTNYFVASPYSGIVEADSYFKAGITIRYKEKWEDVQPDIQLFYQESDGSYFSNVLLQDHGYEKGSTGPMRLSLRQSFLHELYPRIYALAISSDDKKTPIPNEPYTPFAEELVLSYSATDSLDINATGTTEFENRSVQLFHEHPFGQMEEHRYLRDKFDITEKEIVLLPRYCRGGEMYLGLENANPLELISLLVQVAEGTENPEAETFLKGENLRWDVLSNNFWHQLSTVDMPVNDTDNFLKSGLVQLTIPEKATTNNTLLPSGYVWLRIKLNKRFDTVCKLLGVHAQAAAVVFENNGNDLSQLSKGLANGTITKLAERVSQIKTITQPYNSFGGQPEESDLHYYRRVSERLRHKNRAITLWDYEHLILQHFPEVYKVKCLNHTDKRGFFSPGNVSLIVIPDTTDKNVFDNYQPRVSRALLNQIRDYIAALTSMHVNVMVENPKYEVVRITVNAKIKEGYDAGNYRLKLVEDITKMLSPWAFSNTTKVDFGMKLHRSQVIHFIEKLAYVDYIEDLKIFKDGVIQDKNCEPSDPRSILVSARNHEVGIPVKSCSVQPTQVSEKCQL